MLKNFPNCNTIVLQQSNQFSMRSILSVSLPKEEKNRIENRAKKYGKTVSAYILYTTKMEESLIQEEELLKMARKAESDYTTGKTKKLNSLADLLS